MSGRFTTKLQPTAEARIEMLETLYDHRSRKSVPVAMLAKQIQGTQSGERKPLIPTTRRHTNPIYERNEREKSK